MSSELKAIAQANAGLASVFSIGKTVQGRDILALRLNTDASGAEPSSKPGAVFTGTFHAREHLSTEVALLLGRFLAEKKDDPKVRELLRTRDIYILPMINPDGAEYDISTGEYQWHRKNMSRNPDGSTGVDLNRNYGYLWGGAGSSGSPWSDTYRGPSAFSESESKAFKSFLEARRNVKTLISYHSYGELVLYPWGGDDSDVPDAKDLAAYKALAVEMGKLTGYAPQKSSDLYVATGDATDWTYAALGIFSFTIELGGNGFYPGSGIIGPSAKANLKAALYLLGLSDDPRRAAHAAAPGPQDYPESLR
jgi:carboxypeptidase T